MPANYGNIKLNLLGIFNTALKPPFSATIITFFLKFMEIYIVFSTLYQDILVSEYKMDPGPSILGNIQL